MTEILHSKIVGSGEKHLLVFHGLFGQLDNWNTIGKYFGEYFTTHLIDLRNHGRSFHSDDSSLAAMTQDIVNYLDANNIEKAHLLGHSLGGRIVIDFAMIHQDRLDHLIVADMAPKAYQPHHNAIFKALKSVHFDEIENVRKFPKNEYAARLFGYVNVLRSEESKKLSIHTTTSVVIYPEEIKISTNGNFSGKVIETKFQGRDYLINFSYQDLELYAYFDAKLEKGTNINFDLKSYSVI